MQSAIMPKTANTAMISAKRTAILADTPKLCLFTSDISLDENTILADLVEPTGDWYAQATPAISELFDDASGSLKLAIGSSMFNYTGTDPAETIRGAFIQGAVSGLFCAWMLEEPVEMANTLDTVITPVANLTFPPIAGG